ncbi:MAG: glycosyltransferase family 2 protein [Candidatus Dormibacteraeota bacterium]|nr:glycosyltransferase family 2 protein [Candidatus Dormibacteraeota bacterium]
MSGLPRISAVIPVFNSERSLADVVERLDAVLTETTSDHEVILVNDGSRDASWQVITELSAANPRVTGINFSRNYGQHNALLCGIREAAFPIIVTLDDDGQHPPEEIPKLYQALGDEMDVVYGVPANMVHGPWRNFSSWLVKLAMKMAMGVGTARDVSAFRMFRTPLREAFADFRGSYVSVDVLLTWATTGFTSVRVDHRERQHGRSNYTFRRLAVHALNMTTGFSTWPLRLASLLGMAFTVFGLGVLVYVIVRFIANNGSIPGFPFLASTIAIFGGVQLFALGIMGEYLARIHTRTMDRPTYLVRSEAAHGVTASRDITLHG